ncbi:zinc finger protein, putative [Ixodes scapularis]|uniref:Zinc finger protein, putative n=1 Tax=Ixodes scapularis TaxID=6945 RepID=B7P0V5_IXOSC|nr:zinc finger protein, putative [Ixodes scapularis]|eukprot:XP_002399381.1 zinc finger protein, putative [Ixodes scapularis]
MGRSHDNSGQEETPSVRAEDTFPCRDCGGVFSSRYIPEKHREKRHRERSGRYCCSLCPYSSYKRDNVAKHERSSLNVHQTVHTGERPHGCIECGAAFPKKSDLIRHARTHSGSKAYSCHLCAFRASTSSNVKKHVIAVHTKEFPHMCERCGKGFVAPYALRAHLAKKHAHEDQED